jgi:hypothetical protein
MMPGTVKARVVLALSAVVGLTARVGSADEPQAPVVAPPAEPLPAAAPSLAAPVPSARARVPVSFVPSSPDLTLVRSAGTMPTTRAYEFRAGTYYESGHREIRFARVCTGVCGGSLAVGDYVFGVAKGHREQVVVGKAAIDGPVEVHATYVDRRPVRYAGAAVLIAGIGTGVGMMAGASDLTNGGPAVLWSGVALLVTTATVGGILSFMPDKAHLEFTPMSLPPGPPGAPVPRSSEVALRGGAVTLHF